MALDETSASTIMRAQENQPGEACMVDQERWAEIRRLFHEERVSISEIGRRMDLDRKTVRRALRQATWHPYRRAAGARDVADRPCRVCADPRPAGGILGADSVSGAAGWPGYTGSYETVQRLVAPVCYADDSGRRIWNPTFKAFADYWGFEPRVWRRPRARAPCFAESPSWGSLLETRSRLPGDMLPDHPPS